MELSDYGMSRCQKHDAGVARRRMHAIMRTLMWRSTIALRGQCSGSGKLQSIAGEQLRFHPGSIACELSTCHTDSLIPANCCA